MFQLRSAFRPTGDQPEAIRKLVLGVTHCQKNQVLLGVTGSGKTFTMANVIQETQLPTLVISHNKTLAGQLYQEFRDFFPENAVCYFVSYYDFYQPEAYIPSTDTYIEKQAQINDLIDKLRLQATTNILTRRDVIVIASVSCIYNIGSPVEYGRFILELSENQLIDHRQIFTRLAQLQYERSEFDFKRGTFRVRGENIDIYPAYEDFGYRLIIESTEIKKIEKFDPLTGQTINDNHSIKKFIIYPAKHYMVDRLTFEMVKSQIREDLKKESEELRKKGKNLEAERLIRRVNYDLEMIRELGYVNGIENYSRYFDGRKPGEPPFSLLHYFRQAYGVEWLLFIDESHMTVPQLRGMFNGDFSRKKTLVEFGFRLKAAFDNRPLKFEEFYPIPSRIIYVSATPDEWEMNQSRVPDDNPIKKLGVYDKFAIAEQLIRPTGIIDPKIIVRPAKNEVIDLLSEIEKRVEKKEKILVTTLTKKMAEDLSNYLKEKKIKAAYLHCDIDTLERSDILDDLRRGKYDVLIGVNLLREGLDLPEVSLVAILDADKEGFLRSKTSLIQTMGRAARNVNSQVILYADEMTQSMKEAIKEINRRRRYQLEYNKKHQITPRPISKPIREKIIEKKTDEINALISDVSRDLCDLERINVESLTPYDRKKLIKRLRQEMMKQAEELNFELAIKIRDKIKEIERSS